MKVNTNLEVKRTYSVNGVQYDSKEAAQMAFAIDVLSTVVPGGVEEVLKNAEDVIEALKIIIKAHQ